MYLASGLLLIFLVPLALATGHFTVRLRLSSISKTPVRTTLSIYEVEREVTVSGTAYVTMDYELNREYLVRDKPHLLTITTSSSPDGQITAEMELRRFARSAQTVRGRLRIIGESVECQKNFYGPFCWVQCVTSPGDGLICDSEGVPRCKTSGCTLPVQKNNNTPSVIGTISSAYVSEEFVHKEQMYPVVTFETPISTNLLLVLNALLCLIVLSVGLVLIYIGLRLRFIKTENSSMVNNQTQEQLQEKDSMPSTVQDYDLIRFSSTKGDDLFKTARENEINKKIENYDNEYSSEAENIYEIV